MPARNHSHHQSQAAQHSHGSARTDGPARSSGQIGPRVEIVWARQELQRLTQKIAEAELALKSLKSDGQSDTSSEPTASERTLSAERKRLINRKRNLVRWLIGAGVKVSAKDSELARRKPRENGDKVSTKKRNNKSKASSKNKKRTSTGKNKATRQEGEKAVWSGPSHGGRRRVRFIR